MIEQVLIDNFFRRIQIGENVILEFNNSCDRVSNLYRLDRCPFPVIRTEQVLSKHREIRYGIQYIEINISNGSTIEFSNREDGYLYSVRGWDKTRSVMDLESVHLRSIGKFYVDRGGLK